MKTQKIRTLIVLITVFFTFLAPAANEAPEAQLSPAGMRRLEENRQILLKNIEATRSNIENCQTNAGTVAKQSEEIAKVESELLKLKEQYENFLKTAETESVKNREALSNLAKIKNRKLANLEQNERESWSKDTSEKVAKVKTLLQKLKKDLDGVSFQKRDLANQKSHWMEREKHHEKILEELNAKKTETEKRLKGDG